MSAHRTCPTGVELDTRLTHVEQSVEELRKTVYGNGHPGIKAQVQELMYAKSYAKAQITLLLTIIGILVPIAIALFTQK